MFKFKRLILASIVVDHFCTIQFIAVPKTFTVVLYIYALKDSKIMKWPDIIIYLKRNPNQLCACFIKAAYTNL